VLIVNPVVVVPVIEYSFVTVLVIVSPVVVVDVMVRPVVFARVIPNNVANADNTLRIRLVIGDIAEATTPTTTAAVLIKATALDALTKLPISTLAERI
jgi:hypothetical protein